MSETQVQTSTTTTTPAQVPPPVADMNAAATQPAKGNTASPAAGTGALSPQPSGAVATPGPAKPQEIYMGGKKFSSMEELSAYTAELQGKASIADQLRHTLAPPAPTDNTEDELADLIYTDPKKYNKIMEDRITARANQMFEQKLASENVRKNFYEQYPDLKGHEDLVGVYYNNMQKELASQTQDAATSSLANAVRSRLASIRGTKEGTQVLSNGKPVVVGQGGPAPMTSETPAAKTFAQQLADWKSSKKTKTA